MHTDLRLKLSVSKVTVNFQRSGFDSGDFSGLIVDLGHFIAVFFAPHDVHAVEHVGPILAFGAACSRIDLDHRTELIFLLAQHFLEFEFLHGLEDFPVVFLQLLIVHLSGFVKFIKHLQVFYFLVDLIKGIGPDLFGPDTS